LRFQGNDSGGIGFEFYSTVVKPYFEELREKEEAADGSGWDARKRTPSRKSEFLQRVRVTIAKGNSRILDCMRHDWQPATAPDLVTSTVHNPRTLAAESLPCTESLLRYRNDQSLGTSKVNVSSCAQLNVARRRMLGTR
jgi:hypothetical protein